MKAKLWPALALFMAIGAVPAFAAESSCVDCHSNPDSMKAMVAPPVVNAEEGEG